MWTRTPAPGSRWVPALLVLGLLVGCQPPATPVGSVALSWGTVELETIPGTAARSGDRVELSRLGLRWTEQAEGDARSLALAHVELLRQPPAAEAALIWLDKIGTPTCDHHRSRAVALLVDDRLGQALRALAGCDDPPSAALREAALEGHGLRGKQGGDQLDPRDIYRSAARLLADTLGKSSVPDELVETARRHSQEFNLPSAREWWADALGTRLAPEVVDAIERLARHQVARPSSAADGQRRAEEMDTLSRQLEGVAANLLAVRAAHLAAWYRTSAGDTAEHSWAHLAELARDRWPWAEVEGLEQLAQALIDGGSQHRVEASRVLQRAIALADVHHLRDARRNLALRLWNLDRRPSLASAEVTAMLTLFEESAGWGASGRASALRALGYAAWRAGYDELAVVACESALAVPGMACGVQACDDVLFYLAPTEERALRIREALYEREECLDPQYELIRQTALAETLHRTGAPGAAEELQRARDLVPEVTPQWELFVAAVDLLLDDGASDTLSGFDDRAKALAGDGRVDHRGWVTAAYRDLILQRAGRSASVDELWALLDRRGALRLKDSVASPPSTVDRLAVLPTTYDGVLVLHSDRVSRFQPDLPSETFVDLAGVQAAAWITGATAGPELASLQKEVALQPSETLLLQVGSGTELSVPLPALGADRPTAQWVPTQTESIVWEGGVVIAGSAGDGAALYGVDELAAAVTEREWSSGSAQTVAELEDLVREQPVVHLTAHGTRTDRSRAALALSAGVLIDASVVSELPIRPGALVTLAACETAGGTEGDLPLDLPLAALEAGAAAVLYSRYPVRSVPLHSAAERLYAQLPFPCHELPARWHQIRKDFDRDLLGVEVAVSATCLEGLAPEGTPDELQPVLEPVHPSEN